MVVLDTNVFYYLSGVEVNKEVDIQRLQSYIDKNVCLCSIYSYFEILNANLHYKDKLRVLDCLSKNDIRIEYNDFIYKNIVKHLLNKPEDEYYYKKLKHIYGEAVIDDISNNMAFFIISYAYTSATIYIDNYEMGLSQAKKHFRKHFEILQHDVDKRVRRLVKKRLMSLLDEDRFNADNVQKLLIVMTANLMTYYYEWLRNAKVLFENNDKQAYYKLIKIFKKLNKEILKDNLCDEVDFDSRYFSVCKILIDNIGESDNIPKIKISQAKKHLKSKIMDTIFIPNSEMKNEFEEKWLERNINSILVESAKLKPNDFIDYEILRKLYYVDENELLITFDGKMKTILDSVKSSEKFKESLVLIHSFEIK